MKIHISQTTHELLGPDYSTADRGEIVVKGKGSEWPVCLFLKARDSGLNLNDMKGPEEIRRSKGTTLITCLGQQGK